MQAATLTLEDAFAEGNLSAWATRGLAHQYLDEVATPVCQDQDSCWNAAFEAFSAAAKEGDSNALQHVPWMQLYFQTPTICPDGPDLCFTDGLREFEALRTMDVATPWALRELAGFYRWNYDDATCNSKATCLMQAEQVYLEAAEIGDTLAKGHLFQMKYENADDEGYCDDESVCRSEAIGGLEGLNAESQLDETFISKLALAYLYYPEEAGCPTTAICARKAEQLLGDAARRGDGAAAALMFDVLISGELNNPTSISSCIDLRSGTRPTNACIEELAALVIVAARQGKIPSIAWFFADGISTASKTSMISAQTQMFEINRDLTNQPVVIPPEAAGSPFEIVDNRFRESLTKAAIEVWKALLEGSAKIEPTWEVLIVSLPDSPHDCNLDDKCLSHLTSLSTLVVDNPDLYSLEESFFFAMEMQKSDFMQFDRQQFTAFATPLLDAARTNRNNQWFGMELEVLRNQELCVGSNQQCLDSASEIGQAAIDEEVVPLYGKIASQIEQISIELQLDTPSIVGTLRLLGHKEGNVDLVRTDILERMFIKRNFDRRVLLTDPTLQADAARGLLSVKATAPYGDIAALIEAVAWIDVVSETPAFEAQQIIDMLVAKDSYICRWSQNCPPNEAQQRLLPAGIISKVQERIGSEVDGIWGANTQEDYSNFLKAQCNERAVIEDCVHSSLDAAVSLVATKYN